MDFTSTHTLLSSPSIRAQPHQLGIDEAGRGPVLGPMVYAYAACPISSSDNLKSLGFADSKTLNATQRSSLHSSLLSSPFMSAHFISLSPSYLSAQMQSIPRTSLNILSHDTAIALIHHALTSSLHLTHVYVDTVGEPRAYQAKLEAVFPGIEFVVTSKADSLYPIVSAASIVAKVNRDRELEEWAFKEEPTSLSCTPETEGEDLTTSDVDDFSPSSSPSSPSPLSRSASNPTKRKSPSSPSPSSAISRHLGSGYPGDPTTKRWLASHLDPVFGFPSLVRFSWSTAKNLLKDRGYGVVWHDEVDDDRADEDRGKHVQRMEQFMVKKGTSGRGEGDLSVQKAAIPLKSRCLYLQQHKLHLLTSLT